MSLSLIELATPLSIGPLAGIKATPLLKSDVYCEFCNIDCDFFFFSKVFIKSARANFGLVVHDFNFISGWGEPRKSACPFKGTFNINFPSLAAFTL